MNPMRRKLLFSSAIVAATGGLTMGLFNQGKARAANGDFAFQLSEAQWRERLTPAQYAVLRDHATERAGSSPLDDEKRAGVFHCGGCDQPLFEIGTKFDSGTGWPSFFAPIEGKVGTRSDRSWLMVRTEVHCGNCGGHLGHVFDDGPPPTGKRYCMNGIAMTFKPSG